MIEIRSPIGVPVVCALMAMSLQGCANIQMAMNVLQQSPLCEAIVSGNVDRAMQLVKQGEDVNARTGCALLRAAERGQLELVKLLLDHKADPNQYISAELTPLKGAVMSRDVQVVRTLLERGANPRDDFYAFQVVLNLRNAEMAELFLRHGANANMTSPAQKNVYAHLNNQQVTVPRSDLESDRIDNAVKRLQCNVSTLSGGGTSLLYLAAGPGPDDDRIAKLLVGHGADPNAKTINGSTPLMRAASQHNHRVMTTLMDAGANVEATDRCGRTAADYAVLYPQHQRAGLAPQTRALLQDRQRK